MASPQLERRGELIQGLLELLAAKDEPIQAKDAIDELALAVPPNEYESGTFDSGSQRWSKLVRFATIGPVKAGWLHKSKGFWSITDAGREALETYPQPIDLYEAARALYRQWKAESDSLDEHPEPTASDFGATLESAEGAAWTQIRQHLSSMDPYDFQGLVAAVLDAMGYHISWIAPPGPDGGLDIIAHTDPIGATGPRIKVQVKRQESKVATDGIRAFLSLLGTNDVGLFVNFGGFTRDAEDHARHQESRRVTLIDASGLFDMWVENYDSVSQRGRNLLPLRNIQFLDTSALD